MARAGTGLVMAAASTTRHWRSCGPSPLPWASDSPTLSWMISSPNRTTNRSMRSSMRTGSSGPSADLSVSMSLYRLLGEFLRRHWSSYASSGLMLAGIACLIVWIPRQIGHLVDGLAGHSLGGDALLLELVKLVGAGVIVYFLRVGWRLRLFAAAYRLGVELRQRPHARLAVQGPAFFQGSRTGNLMALATNDIDAVEMAAGEAMLAGFDGSL